MIRINIHIDKLLGLIAKVEVVLPSGEVHNDMQREVATSMLAMVTKRIHEEGIATDGSKIGNYSTKPIYVNPDNAAGKRFQPAGKNSKEPKFKNGQPRKTRYFAGGYNDFKTTIGRNTLGSVNLSLSNDMNTKTSVIATEKGYGIGWNEDTYVKRAEYLETKYQKRIWSLTTEEIATSVAICNKHIKDAIS